MSRPLTFFSHIYADNPRNQPQSGAEKEIEQFGRQLANEGFVSKAPAKVVEDIRQKLARAQDKLARIDESIAALG